MHTCARHAAWDPRTPHARTTRARGVTTFLTRTLSHTREVHFQAFPQVVPHVFRKTDARLPGKGNSNSQRRVPLYGVRAFLFQEGRRKATWKREFEIPWRKAGLLTSGLGPVGCQ